MLKTILKYITACLSWLLVRENRIVGIKATLTALSMADKVSELTATKKDDAVISYLANTFASLLKEHQITDEKDLELIAKEISRDDNALKNVFIGYSDGEIEVSSLGLGLGYDFEKESVQFSKSFKF